MKTFFEVIGLLMLIDATAFICWALSGQFPTDGFYIGRITSEIMSLII
jgi:hypothetical protein